MNLGSWVLAMCLFSEAPTISIKEKYQCLPESSMSANLSHRHLSKCNSIISQGNSILPLLCTLDRHYFVVQWSDLLIAGENRKCHHKSQPFLPFSMPLQSYPSSLLTRTPLFGILFTSERQNVLKLVGEIIADCWAGTYIQRSLYLCLALHKWTAVDSIILRRWAGHWSAYSSPGYVLTLSFLSLFLFFFLIWLQSCTCLQ